MWDIKKERILKKMKFTTPIEMPRGTHYGSNYFIVYSHKIKRNVKLYSNLEYYNFLTLETDPNVEYFCEQPGFDASLKYAIDAMGETAFDFYEKFAAFYYREGFQHRSHKKEDLYRIFYAFGQDAGLGDRLEELLEQDLVKTMNFDAVKKFRRKGWTIQ